MKVFKKQISAKDASGSILLLPEVPEDLWHAYNLLQEGDLVRCTTLRKVVKESSTGSTTAKKVRTSLTIRVDKVDFDPDSLQVRISGPNVEESKFVKLGAHHTLTLELDRQFSIIKECWDQIFLDRIDEACNPERAAEIAAIVMQPGLAHLCLVTGSITVTKAKIEITIPKKRTGSSKHSSALKRFYEAIYQSVLRHVDFKQIKCVLTASAGYLRDDWFQYMLEQSVRRDDRPFIENKSKFVLCKASSGHKHALEEVFSDPQIMERMSDTKVAKEVKELDRFMRLIDTDPDKAYYGYNHVSKANEEFAIEVLMVTDDLFRSSDIAVRKKYVKLVESVRENGGKTLTYSSLHVSGQQLGQLSGIAAILRYPLPDLDQLELDALEHQKGFGDDDDDESESESDDSVDPDWRIQEDMQDMGF
uniref:Protein pelota homolog n=1 Tax=Chaetoceros debilis TaxID=122233 RepID=A0A6S8X182_9STRA|mmetsp:Transcript_18446/g.27221  ORF Transcript_18446/g.27221 Transcript_18446/m.27221 type:complete len:419 (-) Transcript_18446:31-1287(-)|eukprot:CAMPEP_0194096024 /NCGR_PEP_ID=MMETSP0149-20130528/57133_1 /TAXON_ID=122233 /ORGANISM="Chaetoceros debilis, Strain MM31A-1" /LENGTH=418 /DNA_ID=CAMNT_0038781991 /DNA_START=68 /DNA_END=1324 /DNA_ORIENTATION=-